MDSLAEAQPRAQGQEGMGSVPREDSPPGDNAGEPEVAAGRRRAHIPADTTVSRPGGAGPSLPGFSGEEGSSPH